MEETRFIPFDASVVPLEGSNLIEASAGTGKTYSIAILVLRLVLEKRMALKEILMVTFTKAAVAELEARIRLFVRLAARAARGEAVADETIGQLVGRAVDAAGSREEVVKLLDEAVLLLDETAVMTIHSFCQQTLHEFALETGQLFGAETLEDSQDLITREVDKFWRREVTGVETPLLKQLVTCGLSRKHLEEVVGAYLGDRPYRDYEAGTDYILSPEVLETAGREMADLVEEKDRLTAALETHIETDKAQLAEASANNRFAKTSFLPLLGDPAAFIAQLAEKRDKGYVQQLYGYLLVELEAVEEQQQRIETRARRLVSRFYCRCIQLAARHIEDFKIQNGVLSFDDMISGLHRAIRGTGAARLISGLQQKYRAVFVDEFQDTDRQQYDIFSGVFNAATILFYIGDPKQSIYGWRKADIDTYLEARAAVNTRYSMNVNYRSSTRYIASMNHFFAPVPDFDTFYFAGSGEGFGYIAVEAPSGTSRPGLRWGSEEAVPLALIDASTKSAIAGAAARQVLELLEDSRWQLPQGEVYRPLQPSDIGILVRTHHEANQVKAALTQAGVPTVSVDDARILQSSEAESVLFLLEAMLAGGRGEVNKALLTPAAGFDRETLLSLDPDMVQERFRHYGSLWSTKSVYVALQAFMNDFDVYGRLLNQAGAGERKVANLLQLAEVLHKTQAARQLTAGELTDWLRKGAQGMTVTGDEFEQRIESDEDAVRIVTIHKSKGLEYNVVLAPFLDFADASGSTRDFESYRDGQGQYRLSEPDRLDNGERLLLERRREQENRRLIYVAVTRAVFGCFIFNNTGTRYATSSLSVFRSALTAAGAAPGVVRFASADSLPVYERYSGRRPWRPVTVLRPPARMLEDIYWRRLSYTFLAGRHHYERKDDSHIPATAYDDFVFKQLARGNVTGNMVHEVLEHIDFSSEEGWDDCIAAGLRRYLPGAPEVFAPMLGALLRHIVRAPVQISGTQFLLSEVSRSARLSELEFDFQAGQFINTDLLALATGTLGLAVGAETRLAGVMNGKIDLLFGLGDRYYIVDWKSNFLGDTLDYYTPPRLAEAMSENNYHLQYLLYCLAVKRYLTFKLPDFDYERDFGGVLYVFIRGVREGTSNGLFTARPTVTQLSRLEQILLGEAVSGHS